MAKETISLSFSSVGKKLGLIGFLLAAVSCLTAVATSAFKDKAHNTDKFIERITRVEDKESENRRNIGKIDKKLEAIDKKLDIVIFKLK